MAARNINGYALALGLAGSVLLYSGIRGKSFSTSARALLAGQSPSTTTQTYPIDAPAAAVTDPSGFVLSSSSSTGGLTQGAFYADVLRGIGAPVTQGALNALAGITQTEGVNNYFNPLNIEWHQGDNPAWEGVSNFNAQGVQRYGSYQQGVAATVAYLTGNSGWSNVVAALKSGNQAMAEAALTAKYTWATFKKAGSNANSLLSAPVGG